MYTNKDRCFSDILVAEGYSETITTAAEAIIVNNAPATPNDSFHEEEEKEDDDDPMENFHPFRGA